MKMLVKILPKYMWIPILFAILWNWLAYQGTRYITTPLYHYNLTNDVDNQIPVIPAAMIIYWGCYLFWVINYIIGCRQEEDIAFRFISAEFLAKLGCMIIYIAFPTTNVRPDIDGNGFFEDMMRQLYSVDAADNLFPSIHCLMSWMGFIAVRKNPNVKGWYKVVSLVIAILVFISTLTTKQHVLVDIAGGVILAEGSYYLTKKTGFVVVYKRFMKKVGGVFKLDTA